MAQWTDIDVQTIYQLLCETEAPPDGEHYEGWIAMKIADALRVVGKIDGLEEDLKSAVQVAWHRGATEWVRMNYPKDAERLERVK